MERPIMKDPIFLAQKSERAAADDLDVARDLLDTLKAHREGCVGMAANMIGIAKRIIVFDNEGEYMTMLNPEIVKFSQPYARRRAACRWRGRVKRSDTAPSRCGIRMRRCRSGSRPSRDGRRRSSSTRSTTATGF